MVTAAVNTDAVDFMGEPTGTLSLTQTVSAPALVDTTVQVPAYLPVSFAAKSNINTPAYHGYAADGPAATGYKVPNFGQDVDIIATNKHIADSEKKMKHKWTPLPNPDKYAKNYFVPNFGLDRDIIEAGKSIQSTESSLNKSWNPKQDKDGQWVVPEPIDNSSYSYSG